MDDAAGGQVIVRSSWRAIPDEFHADPQAWAAAQVYARLSWYGRSGRGAWPGKERLAADCGIGLRTVERYIKWLRDNGWVTVKQQRTNGHQGTNLYFVNEYPWQSDESSPPAVAVSSPPVEAGSHASPVAVCDETSPQVAEVETGSPMTETPNDTLNPQGVQVAVVVSTPRRVREPDLLWESFLDVCNVSQKDLSKERRGALNGMVANLRRLGATPEDVYYRAGNWPWDVPLTPEALSRRWAELAQPHRSVKTDATTAAVVAYMQGGSGGPHDGRHDVPTTQVVLPEPQGPGRGDRGAVRQPVRALPDRS